jgi:dephospho-CoA kinase
MKIIYLTGSIATGKSTILEQFKRCGIPVLNTDVIAHALLAENGKAVLQVAAIFPETLVNIGKAPRIDRQKLGEIVFADNKKLRQLEKILHPQIRIKEQQWIRQQRRLGRKIVVIEVPLFFENWRKYNPHSTCVAVSSASLWMMKNRALKRSQMTREKLQKILKRQWPTARKKAFATMVIHSQNKALMARQTKRLLVTLFSLILD